MTFPTIAALTGGLLIVFQNILMVWAGLGRGKHQVALGTGGIEEVEKRIRAHGNLAENAAIFVISLALLEMSNMHQAVVMALAAAFVLARFAHAYGLGILPPGANKPRLLGTVVTGLVGLTTGGLLIWQLAPTVAAM